MNPPSSLVARRPSARFSVGAGLFLALLGFAGCAGGPPEERADDPRALTQAESPTFHEHVQPILQDNCVTCHQEARKDDIDGDGSGFYSAGLVAPMSLETYETARDWAPLIAEAVESRRMPPFGASVEFRGAFKDERYLDEDEIATLVAWARAGAPRGDPADARAVPAKRAEREAAEREAPGEWAIGEPDLVVRFDEPFHVADDVVDQYVDIHVKLDREDHPRGRWIRASEVRAGSDVVHHINSRHLGTIAPGRESAYELPEGYGIFLPDTATLFFDMHYHKDPGPGTGADDRSGGAAVFYEEGEVVDYAVETTTSFEGLTDLLVPAGAKNYSHTVTKRFEEDTYLLSSAPHMHYRGKAARLELEYPNGRREVLIDVPRYDFRWQHKYEFRDPVLMPAGSTLHLTGWWDNSADNPDNPDPTRDVPFGLPSTDEMLTGRIFYARAEPMNHVVGRAPIPEHVLDDAQRYREQVESQSSGETTNLVTADGPE